MENIHVNLNDRTVGQIQFAPSGQYLAHDEKLKGFYLLVGKKSRRYMVKGRLRAPGKSPLTVKVSVGDATEITAAKARVIAAGYLSEIKQGRHPKPDDVRSESLVAEVVAETAAVEAATADGPTLLEAWEEYKAALIKKERSARTIRGYEDHVTQLFKTWNDTPLKELADDPAKVKRRHSAITEANGPYAANGAMRTLSAIYNYAYLNHRKVLPRDNPVEVVDFNKEHRRNTSMGLTDLPGWFGEMARIENPIRREFHLFTLLSSSRPAALKAAKPEHLHLDRRVLHIPGPKGGSDRAFDIPLSRPMIACLMRAMRFSRSIHPEQARQWIFAAASKSGHISETKEDRKDLSKWGNDLRQTHRTLAVVARVPRVDAKLLMNHSLGGDVNDGYITRDKLVEDHLRAQQQAISDVVFRPVREEMTKHGPLRDWLGPRGARNTLKTAAAVDTHRQQPMPARPIAA